MNDRIAQKLIDDLEDHAAGVKVTQCDVMWRTWNLLQKAEWFWKNRVNPSVARDERARVDAANAALREAEDDDRESISYPWWAEPWPQGTLSIKAEVKLVAPIEYVSVSFTVDG